MLRKASEMASLAQSLAVHIPEAASGHISAP